jgi:hypothetical protein
VTGFFHVRGEVRVLDLLAVVNELSVGLWSAGDLAWVGTFEDVVEPLVLVVEDLLFPSTPDFVLWPMMRRCQLMSLRIAPYASSLKYFW